MDTMRPTILVCLEIAAVLAAAPVCVGCVASAPGVNVSAPALAFAATDTDVGPGGCAIGPPRILGTTAAPPVGVSARAESSRVWLRFAPTTQERLAMAIDPVSLDVLETLETSPPSIRSWAGAAPSGGDDTALWSASHKNEVFAWIDGGRSILAWTEGSLETAKQVRVQTFDRGGEPLDSPVALDHEGSVVGAPALAVGSSGRGVLAFIESNGHGFQLVAASLDCSTRR
jgi:hypothetical protein